jgi:hypothetical protein
MKRVTAAALLFLSVAGAIAMGAQQKTPAEVNVDALTKECQGSASDGTLALATTKGMNFIWYIPKEFWEVSLLQNKSVTPEQAQQTIKELEGIFIVCVVRSKVDRTGTFDFIDEETVTKDLVVQFTDKDGKATTLQTVEDLNPTTGAILGAMKPAIRANMGNLGKNMYFFVYKDTGKDGKRLVTPSVPGKLTVTLKPIAGENGGKLDIAFPLNSLFVPRECTKCHAKDLNIQWLFCPHCGTAIKP